MHANLQRACRGTRVEALAVVSADALACAPVEALACGFSTQTCSDMEKIGAARVCGEQCGGGRESRLNRPRGRQRKRRSPRCTMGSLFEFVCGFGRGKKARANSQIRDPGMSRILPVAGSRVGFAGLKGRSSQQRVGLRSQESNVHCVPCSMSRGPLRP